jgi:hypothetical protein
MPTGQMLFAPGVPVPGPMVINRDDLRPCDASRDVTPSTLNYLSESVVTRRFPQRTLCLGMKGLFGPISSTTNG